MIFDTIKNSKLYTGLGPDLKTAFEFIGNNNFKNAPPGRYPLKGGMYYNVQHYETKAESEGFFEAHRKFIDLQYIVSGKERHGYAHLSLLKQRDPYNEEKDLVVYDGKGSFFTLDEGFFAIYFPEDAHMPNIRTGADPVKMVKVVFKIPV
jgi:YhcH/YjgK/YiaL family protein